MTSIYHPFFIIVTKDNQLTIPILKEIDNELIKVVKENNMTELLYYITEIALYSNNLGNEIIYPIKLINNQLLDMNTKLITKDIFTFNILVCGKPFSGKSTLINTIIGKKKALHYGYYYSSGKNIIKYIHNKLPISIFHSPGFETEEEIYKLEKLIKDKNKELNKDNSRIHCILYFINSRTERTFKDRELLFIISLLEQDFSIFIVLTHAGNLTLVKDYKEVIKLQLPRFNHEKLGKLIEFIYPIELIDDKYYKKFGLKELFLGIYNKYKINLINEEITKYNINRINSNFIF